MDLYNTDTFLHCKKYVGNAKVATVQARKVQLVQFLFLTTRSNNNNEAKWGNEYATP